MNPVAWWHRQEGGKIAEDRPPPPGADQPYPNMSTVPPKPAPADQEAMKQLTDSLIADRTNAQHEAQAAPLPDPSSPTASPNLFGVGTAPPPPPQTAAVGTPVASASMPAVTAPVTAPSAAPRKPVRSAPLPPLPTAAAPPVVAGAATPPTATSQASAPPTGPQPALPAAPPPRPAVAGPVPPTPLTPKPMPAPSGGKSATIVFPDRASDLSQPAAGEVKAFAATRGKGTISVIGYGDSSASDPDAQSAAVNLGLERAQSIVDALKAAGVPGDAIRVSAEASGRGASLQLLQ